MTIITKVGASYIDHMNDDAPEVNSFNRECYQALSTPPFWGESLGTRLGHVKTRLDLRRVGRGKTWSIYHVNDVLST